MLLVCFFVFYEKVEKNLLVREIHSLKKFNLSGDRYLTKIQTRGNYGLVEKAIKEYLDDYALHYQSVLEVVHDPKLEKLLSIENYSSDGDDFVQSFAYLEKTKKKFNQDINLLIEFCNQDKIQNYIRKTIVDPYFVQLYHTLMFDDGISKDILKSRQMFQQTKVDVNRIFDLCSVIFQFLKTNRDQWKIQDGQIQFQTVELMNQYNYYIARIQ